VNRTRNSKTRRLESRPSRIVDTNADPGLSLSIPGNDDAIRAIRVMLQNWWTQIVSANGESRLHEEVGWQAFPPGDLLNLVPPQGTAISASRYGYLNRN
jgi:hypothetical protein